VAPTLPADLTVNTYGDDAYLGVVGSEMAYIRPRGSPVGLSFSELNLRTYADGPAGPGAYFLSLDADDPLGVSVARSFFELPYYRAQMTDSREGERRLFRSNRVHMGAPTASFEATYEPTGTPSEAEVRSLDAFLTERYHFYVADDDGQTYVSAIEHPPWQLQEMDLKIRRNDLFTLKDFERPEREPDLLCSPEVNLIAK